MKFSLEDIRQYPNPDLLAFFEASTDAERSIIHDQLQKSVLSFNFGSRSRLQFTIIAQNKRYRYSLLGLAILLEREDLINFLCSKYPANANYLGNALEFEDFAAGAYVACTAGDIKTFDRLFKYNCRKHTLRVTDSWVKEPFGALFQNSVTIHSYPLYTYYDFFLPSSGWRAFYINSCYGGNLPMIQHIHKKAAWRGIITESFAFDCLFASIVSGNMEVFNYVWETLCKAYPREHSQLKRRILALLTQGMNGTIGGLTGVIIQRSAHEIADFISNFHIELANILLDNNVDNKQIFLSKYQQAWSKFTLQDGCWDGTDYLPNVLMPAAVLPERIQDSIEFIKESILTGNIGENHLDTVRRLLRNSSNNKTKILNAFVQRLKQNVPNDPTIIMLMSTIPEFFVHASLHPDEFKEWYTQPLLREHLPVFLEQKNSLGKRQALLCLGFLLDVMDKDQRYVRGIFANNREIITNLFLFPSVREAIAEHVLSIENNCAYQDEFLRKALDISPPYQTELLLGIPQVSEKVNAIRARNARGSTGVPIPQAVLENHPESATRPLSSSEQNILDEIKNRYTTQTSNIEIAYQECLQALNDRYNDKPIIFITSDKVQIPLPLKYKDFEPIESTLSETDKKAAREAYYAHPVHTAIRFLSEPNRWMADSALWVNRTGRVAKFSDYLKEICSFWYAVNDESNRITPFDKDGSIDFFVDCLCEAARAHNRDHGTDDKRADAPSCGPGMLRRFIQTTTLIGQSLPENGVSQPATEQRHNSNNKPAYTQENFDAEKIKWIFEYYAERLSFHDTRILVDAMADPESENSKKIMLHYDIPQPNIRSFAQGFIDKYHLPTVPVEAILNDLNPSVPHVMAYSQLLSSLINTRYIESIQRTKDKLTNLKGKHFNEHDLDKTTAYLDSNRIINADTLEKSMGAILSSQQAMNALHDSICHRGFGSLPLAARATLGVLAYLFILPAIAVKCYAKATVKETFFGSPKPETARHVHDAKIDFEKTFEVLKSH